MSACAVVHVTSLFGGGVDRHVRDIVSSVPRSQVIWHVEPGIDVIEEPGRGPCRGLDSRRFEDDPEALARWLESGGVGLVHLHSTSRAARRRATWACERLGVRLVVTLHDVLFLRRDAFDRPDAAPDPDWLAETSMLLRSACAVLAPSRFIADLAEHHVDGVAVDVVPNGSRRAAPGVHPAARADFVRHRPASVVAILGAIGPHKGSDLIEELPALLEGTAIGVVVIGYLDRQLFPGWRVPGRLYVHGAYADEEAPGLLAAYGAELALFPNRAPESFSYALSDAWAAGVPALAAPLGALAERIERHGGGLLLPASFGAREVAEEMKRLLGPSGAAELTRVRSQLSRSDPQRIPELDAMARSLDALYARFGIDPASPRAADPAALERLVATNLDGALFRQELARLADEFAQTRAALEDTRERAAKFELESREWIAKLERDVAELSAQLSREVEERRRLGEENAQLTDHRDALELLPTLVRKLLLKKIRNARS